MLSLSTSEASLLRTEANEILWIKFKCELKSHQLAAVASMERTSKKVQRVKQCRDTMR